MQVTIVGVKRSEYEKDGVRRESFNYCGTREYTDYEKENSSCVGLDVIKEFSSKYFDVHPGDVVDFVYEPGYQGKAQLVNIRMISASGDKSKEK